MLKEDPKEFERLTNLRDGIRCGRDYFESGHYLLAEAGDFQQLVLCDEKGEVISTDLQKILNKVKCKPEEKGTKVTENFNKIIAKAKRRFEKDIEHRKSQLKHRAKQTASQKYIDRELRTLLEDADDENKQLQINKMQNAFLSTHLSPYIKKILNKMKANEMIGVPLLSELIDVYHQHQLEEKHDRHKRVELEEKPVKIVCSMVFKD